MKAVTYLNSLDQISLLEKGEEVLLSPLELSRFGRLSLSELKNLCSESRRAGLRPVLEWDILMPEEVFSKAQKYLDQIPLEEFAAIRVQDPGAFYYMLENYPTMPLQLILENGNHNLKAILNWMECGASRLERVILSQEIPQAILKDYLPKINERGVQCELLGLGQNLIFYSPRYLLSPLRNDSKITLEAYASSEESSHKNFPLRQNDHGTFMFNTKDHFLLDFISDLEEMGLTYLRIDLRHLTCKDTLSLALDYVRTKRPEILQKLKDDYPRKTSFGLFRSNRTDVLFKKLKNQRIKRQGSNFLGDIVDVRKKKLMGLFLKNPKLSLKIGDIIEIRTPEGKIKESQVLKMLNLVLEDIQEGKGGQVIFLPHIGGVSVRSAVFKIGRYKAQP